MDIDDIDIRVDQSTDALLYLYRRIMYQISSISIFVNSNIIEGDDWNLPILTDDIPPSNHELPITPHLQQIYTKNLLN